MVYTGPIWFILVHPGSFWSIQVHSGPTRFILVHTGPPWLVLVPPGPFWFILVHPGSHCGTDSSQNKHVTDAVVSRFFFKMMNFLIFCLCFFQYTLMNVKSEMPDIDFSTIGHAGDHSFDKDFFKKIFSGNSQNFASDFHYMN